MWFGKDRQNRKAPYVYRVYPPTLFTCHASRARNYTCRCAQILRASSTCITNTCVGGAINTREMSKRVLKKGLLLVFSSIKHRNRRSPSSRQLSSPRNSEILRNPQTDEHEENSCHRFGLSRPSRSRLHGKPCTAGDWISTYYRSVHGPGWV